MLTLILRLAYLGAFFLKIIRGNGEKSDWLINFQPVKSITIFHPSFIASSRGSPA